MGRADEQWDVQCDASAYHLYRARCALVNYHVHVLVTEGGLNGAGEWVSQTYLSYQALRKVWQYECLTRLRTVLPSEPAIRQLLDELFKRYGNGFYVHAEPKVEDGQGISRYIGRYIRHPAIADTRILAYDGATVTFYYADHQGTRHEQTLPMLEFIHGVVRHIPPKHFKMVRYFGLYAPRKAAHFFPSTPTQDSDLPTALIQGDLLRHDVDAHLTTKWQNGCEIQRRFKPDRKARFSAGLTPI